MKLTYFKFLTFGFLRVEYSRLENKKRFYLGAFLILIFDTCIVYLLKLLYCNGRAATMEVRELLHYGIFVGN